jgi:hypothetical protein
MTKFYKIIIWAVRLKIKEAKNDYRLRNSKILMKSLKEFLNLRKALNETLILWQHKNCFLKVLSYHRTNLGTPENNKMKTSILTQFQSDRFQILERHYRRKAVLEDKLYQLRS